MCRSFVGLLGLAVVAGLVAHAQADGLIANWTFDETSGTSYADASGNGHTGTLVGADTPTSVPGRIGTGLSFPGATGTGNYISVPYSADLSGQTHFALSAWVNVASLPVYAKQEIFNLSNQLGSGNLAYEFGFCASNLSRLSWLPVSQQDNGFSSQYTPAGWTLVTAVFDGADPTWSVSFFSMYVNGVCVRGNEYIVGGPGVYGPFPMVSAAANQILQLAGGDNGWKGGLDDLGMWNVNITGAPYSVERVPTIGASGGEISALYNTPMSGKPALSQYGVKAMDQLFTLYDTTAAGTAAVTTANGTLTWQYVASGLPGTSGSAGQLGDGRYYVQLDGAGGGVVTLPVPEPATLALLLASGLLGLLAYARRKRK